MKKTIPGYLTSPTFYIHTFTYVTILEFLCTYVYILLYMLQLQCLVTSTVSHKNVSPKYVRSHISRTKLYKKKIPTPPAVFVFAITSTFLAYIQRFPVYKDVFFIAI